MGYGRKWDSGRQKMVLVTRWVMEQVHGPLGPGVHVLHRCDHPMCFRYAHLFLGTASDNMHDMVAKGRRLYAIKTHCLNGHEFTPENTYVAPNGQRECRRCNAARQRKYRATRSISGMSPWRL